jgi:predicted GNAT family N-acyltransferase
MLSVNSTHIFIERPYNFTPAVKDEVIRLIVSGGQIKYNDAKLGIHRAELLAIYKVGEQIIATASFKNPRNTYLETVFGSAGIPEQQLDFPFELGYIVVREGFEGQNICQKLLGELFPRISQHPMFATTRKPAMAHILKNMGFEKCGEVYKKDLELMTYKPAVS